MDADTSPPAPTDSSVKLRAFYARYVAERGQARNTRIEQAFASVPKEPFAGPPPWFIFASSPWRARGDAPQYLQTPDGDPAFLYQDVLVALDPGRGINIGEPSLHARCLDALAPGPGETIIHVGAGSGYYSAILSELVGPEGRVHAFEIDPALAERARRNLAPWAQAELLERSGAGGTLPRADAVYVSAGLTQPDPAWLAALNPGGRLLFPLQSEEGSGGMLLALRRDDGGPDACDSDWPARFITRAAFIPCQAPQEATTGRGLAAAFAGGGWEAVQSLRLRGTPDETSWFSGEGWWLSTEAAS